jgi:hypothetical protein
MGPTGKEQNGVTRTAESKYDRYPVPGLCVHPHTENKHSNGEDQANGPPGGWHL